MRQAVILAGGKGTRLAERLNGRPKPLVDVLGRPLLERQVEQLRIAGFRRIDVMVNHKAQQIASFCTEHDNWGLDLRLIDDGEPRGTAGAVLAVLDQMEDEFLVVYGDTLFDIDFRRFLDFHAQDAEAAASLFLHPNDHPQDSDLVELGEDGSIRAFHAYPHPKDAWLPNMVNAALYAVRRGGLERARPAFPAEGVFDFAKDAFPYLLSQGVGLRGYVSSEYIKDIGTPDRLDRACAALASGKVERASLRTPQTAVFLDRDGTLNRANGYVTSPDKLDLFPFSAEAVRLLNGSGRRAVLITNQPVIARGDCTVEQLSHIHAKLETLLGREGAFLDRIYYCPHHPDRGFAGEVAALKVDCDCRKPKPGLLLRAQADLNIDLAASWMIGDGAADVHAAAACGVTSVLVRSGETADTAELETLADFTFDDVLDAAEFIVEDYPKLAEVAAPIVQGLTDRRDLFVAGQSKSGKTTFARTVARELRAAGRSAVVVSIDRWMLPDAERTPGLLGRFDLDGALTAYAAAAQRRAGAVRLDGLPVFSARTRTRLQAKTPLQLEPQTIVIWEGVIALAMAERLGALDRCVFVDSEEPARRRRVIAEYVGRGRTPAEAEKVYSSRLSDEVSLIEAGRASTAQVLSLDGRLGQWERASDHQ